MRKQLPFTRLVDGVTPAERLDRLGRERHREIWVKRDDLTSGFYGGNKTRKLEFILAHALSVHKKKLVTLGGWGTHHGLAVALWGRRMGFEVKIVLFRQPLTGEVRRNLDYMKAAGARLVPAGGMIPAWLRHALLERLLEPDAYFIPAGGSSVRGVLGMAEAGLELADQVRRGEIPEPAMTVVAAGTCGTQAGLLLGLRLAGLRTKVVGVRVTPRFSAHQRQVARMATEAGRFLRRLDPTVPEITFQRKDILLDHSQYGAGYGHATDAGLEAAEIMAREENIILEPTYTAKALAFVMKMGQGAFPGPVLFWNTHNSADVL